MELSMMINKYPDEDWYDCNITQLLKNSILPKYKNPNRSIMLHHNRESSDYHRIIFDITNNINDSYGQLIIDRLTRTVDEINVNKEYFNADIIDFHYYIGMKIACSLDWF